MHSPRALDLSPPGGGANRPHLAVGSTGGIILNSSGALVGLSGKIRLPPPPHLSTQSPPPSSVTPTISHPDRDGHEGTVSPPAFQQPPPSVNSAAAAFIAAAAAAAAAQTSPTSDHESNHNLNQDPTRPRIRSRRGRGGRSARSERMSAAIGSGSPRSLSEMSVRGLDLLRYATLAPDGTYRLIDFRIRISYWFLVSICFWNLISNLFFVHITHLDIWLKREFDCQSFHNYLNSQQNQRNVYFA